MSINGIRFIITKSRHIKFTTIQFIPNANEETLLNSITKVDSIYRLRGFRITTLLVDRQFACLEEGLRGSRNIALNTCSNDEHVGEIERMIRTVKERCRGVYNTLPFRKLPGRMTIEMAYFCVFWLNTFYPSPSIVENLSPRTIMTGRQVDFAKHCKYEFGSYVQTHEEHDNSMRTRTIGAIAL